MVTDADSQSLEGEIVGPDGDGQWLSVPDAYRVTGVSTKTYYRRIEHNRIPSRKNEAGQFEVWIAQSPPATPVTDARLSRTVGMDMLDARELLAPLARALADSQHEALTATARAARAETKLEAAQEELAALKARLSRSRPGRLAAFRCWWHFWILGETGD